MAARYLFALRIHAPEDLDVDMDTVEAIADGAVEGDDSAAARLRLLGSLTSAALDTLNEILPEGWYAKIEGGTELR